MVQAWQMKIYRRARIKCFTNISKKKSGYNQKQTESEEASSAKPGRGSRCLGAMPDRRLGEEGRPFKPKMNQVEPGSDVR